MLQAFDLDGVLIRGKGGVPGAVEALKRLTALRVPFIFVTNGGGVTEANKAAELCVRFGIEVSRPSHAMMICF